MRKILFIAAFIAGAALVPAYGQEDKAKTWCTDAHMQQMDDSIAKMTDAEKQKEAESHLAMSKEAMQNKDMNGCELMHHLLNARACGC